MNPALKQRLVGAIVLVALAVIFLPMLLDGSGAREELDEEIAIPEKPEPPESRLEPAEPSTSGDEAAPVGEGAAATEPAPDAADRADEAPGGAEDAAGDAGAATDTADTADTADATTPSDDAPGADAAAGDAKVEEGWVVQVGSFARETNALVLRDRLRQEGFNADAERARADGRTMYRVLVGPVAERAEGEDLKRRLEELRGEQALLMSYP